MFFQVIYRSLLGVLVFLAYSGSSLVRFVLFSMEHSGTHYLRNVIMQQPDVYFWDEVCILRTFDNVFNVTKCLDRIGFALALPAARYRAMTDEQVDAFIHHRMHKNTFNNSAKPVCPPTSLGAGYSAHECFEQAMQRARAVGCIVQMYQGWGALPWMVEFMELVRTNRQRGIDIKVIFLRRLNSIAHSISAANTKDFLPNQSYPLKHIDVRPLAVKYADLRNKYYNTIRSLLQNGIPVVYVSYERLLCSGECSKDRAIQVAKTFEQVMIALDIPVSNAIQVSTSTKHHVNSTLSYVENVDEVLKQLSELNAGDSWPVRACMLNDSCEYPQPAVCNQIVCFI